MLLQVGSESGVEDDISYSLSRRSVNSMVGQKLALGIYTNIVLISFNSRHLRLSLMC